MPAMGREAEASMKTMHGTDHGHSRPTVCIPFSAAVDHVTVGRHARHPSSPRRNLKSWSHKQVRRTRNVWIITLRLIL